MIIVRQRGTRFRPGPGTGIGKDDTIFAMRDGKVAFRTQRRTPLRRVVDRPASPATGWRAPASRTRALALRFPLAREQAGSRLPPVDRGRPRAAPAQVGRDGSVSTVATMFHDRARLDRHRGPRR